MNEIYSVVKEKIDSQVRSQSNLNISEHFPTAGIFDTNKGRDIS